jgi:hypothetical protein
MGKNRNDHFNESQFFFDADQKNSTKAKHISEERNWTISNEDRF